MHLLGPIQQDQGGHTTFLCFRDSWSWLGPPLPPQTLRFTWRTVFFGVAKTATANILSKVVWRSRSAGRTGFAMPKKITTPWPPQRLESVSSGVPKQLSMSCQLFTTQTSPAGLTLLQQGDQLHQSAILLCL